MTVSTIEERVANLEGRVKEAEITALNALVLSHALATMIVHGQVGRTKLLDVLGEKLMDMSEHLGRDVVDSVIKAIKAIPGPND